ncbi:hypothetical protein KFL_000300020 [Klebsormidium nitens]|uniref:Band 7 domain-containing protein n=1 Tax=Klebsormidium nitens TaxID=105231 RepID=A0A0U9HKP6_KLENI|nr:hypothetical protein KFL_000300020 [Klebsormidium nitens]|eukprot:GAQ79405.1 hypothetical protein KFL_000300020 [Klebsormidium nitens]
MLQSSLTPGRGYPSYVALSSGLASHAGWKSFGVYSAPGRRVSQRPSRKCRQKNVIVMDLFDDIADFLADGVRRTAVIIGAAVLVLALGSFSFVPSGSVGIRTTFGQVERQALLPGLHFNYPLVSDIRTQTTKTQLIVADESDVPTKEGLVVELDVSILHSLQPGSAADLYITVGPDYVNKIILPELHSAVANITSEYSARALYTDARAQLTRELTSYLQQKLTHKGIVIEDVLLRAIKLPEQLTNAIQDKLRTEQEAQRMEFVLLKEQQEAQRKRIEAEGIATFQKIVSEGISPQLLQWKGIEATQELAKSPNSKIVVIGNAKDGLPIILGGEAEIVKAKSRKCRTPVILAGRGPARGTAWTFIGIFTGVFVAALLALTSFVIVPSGSVGVRTTFSQVERQVLQPGVYFINPLVSSIQNFTTKTQLIVADESDVPTKEGLVVELDVSILHSLEPAKAADLYVTVGPDYVNKIILPELHSAVANITSEYSARALYTDARAQLTRELTSYLQHKLSHKGIVIEDVLLRAIKLPEQLTNAIQDKLRTEQEAQRMEFVLLKEQQEAERKMIEAKGIATFQKIVSQGISPQLLQWKGIEATQELAKSQNSKIVLIGNAANGLPIILGGADNKKR